MSHAWHRGVWRAATAAVVVAAVLTGAVACTPATSTPVGSHASPSAASGRDFVVVGLGDSVMAGTACGCRPFLEQYAAALGARQHTAARAVNLGRSGLTVPGLTAQVGGTAARAAVAAASVVVVTIGANDLVPLVARWQKARCAAVCVDAATSALEAPLEDVLARVRREAPPNARLLVTTYWNVFEDGDVADEDYGSGFARWSDGVTAAANARICAAARTAGATCVDLHRPFTAAGAKNPTSLLADDGDHPSAAGHALIAATLLGATPSSTP